ncbi:MAG: EAL domain-containing protein, partial [Clostridia bacterium]|nr:EAL domain-containing protein [Clostridia bacterium]
MLVEDDIVNQEMIKASLGGIYDLIVVETGERALEIIREQYKTLSIVILDLNLPGIKGQDVLDAIKSDAAFSGLPVIVMTSDENAEVACLTRGAIDFIPKPYPASEVIRARTLRIVELSEDRNTLRFTERDHLTGLYNKEFFFRYATQLDLFHYDTPTDAIVFDINHFRTVNDRFGKARGDEILRHISEKAMSVVNETGGIICRSESDTFMLYCPHLSDYEAFFNRITDLYGDDTQCEIHIRLRMGVYSNVDKALDIERRFDRAKMAADLVKGNLTNPIGFFNHSMRDAELFAEQLIDDFPAAIREKQFAVYYQPKFNIRGERPVLCSAEALVRWKHPQLGIISPGIFIPLFEKNGLIQRLDRYVWSEAAKQIRRFKESLGISLPISVNVSRIDLYDPGIADNLLSIVKENGLTSEELLLEITESAYTENQGQIAAEVSKLRECGFKIEMDDFGSGYSSLGMLSKMPVDALKLDMELIKNAFKEDQKDTRLL